MILKNKQSKHKVPLPKIRRLLFSILQELGILKADLDITFVDDPAMRVLNRKFRGIDRPTDVLSFPLWEKKEAFRDGRFLGDVVISVPTTLRQAKEEGRAFLEEMASLIIHGTLHLLGYDHEGSRREAEKMQRMEKKLWVKIQKRFFDDL